MIFNNIEHSILSAKNQKMRLQLLGTLNYARLSTWSRNHNAEHACRIGTLASSAARVDTSYEMIQQKTRSTSRPCWISSLSRTFTSGRAGHTVTDTGRKKVAKNSTQQNNFKRGVERNNTKTFTIDLSVTRGSERQ